jgi:hypothetical protein
MRASPPCLLLAIQAATSCEVVGKVESRDDAEGVTKVSSALLIALKSGLKVENATIAAGAQTMLDPCLQR